VRLKRLKEKKDAHERLMAKKLKDPLTWRTNWKELQENIKNDLFRRYVIGKRHDSCMS
jgi:hypothetical protein